MNFPAPYTYVLNKEGKGYLLLNLDPALFAPLPQTLAPGKVLAKKTEFHVTLASLPDVVARVPNVVLSVTEPLLLDSFVRRVQTQPMALEKFIDDFRYVHKDTRETLVVRCRVSGLEGLYREWEQILGGPIGDQPTHVTLYTLQPNLGIGINTEDAMEQYEKLEFPDMFATLTT